VGAKPARQKRAKALKGIDSSVLLRYILEDDPLCSKVATHFIDEHCTAKDPAYVNVVVLVEVIWSLRRQRGYRKETVVAVIRDMLESQSLVIEKEEIIAEALRKYEADSAGFSDCLIACLNDHAQAKPTFSFDKDAIKRGIFAPIKR
jgi:predicted nucleic-acid-binding protein